jgi:hypothetical protein
MQKSQKADQSSIQFITEVAAWRKSGRFRQENG